MSEIEKFEEGINKYKKNGRVPCDMNDEFEACTTIYEDLENVKGITITANKKIGGLEPGMSIKIDGKEANGKNLDGQEVK